MHIILQVIQMADGMNQFLIISFVSKKKYLPTVK